MPRPSPHVPRATVGPVPIPGSKGPPGALLPARFRARGPTVTAMMLAARGWPSWRLLLATLVGGTLAAGAANVFNCYFDRDIDRLMHRTQRRPLPSGAVSPRAALIFGIVLSVTSIVLL